MAGFKWIRIVTDIFDDEKIRLIEGLPNGDTLIVIWIRLLCFAGKNNNNGVFMFNRKMPYTDEMLASIFNRDIKIIRMALKTFEQFGMIELVNDVITIPNWEKYQSQGAYEKKKEYDRLYQQQRREKQRMLICGPAKKSYDESHDESYDESHDESHDESYDESHDSKTTSDDASLSVVSLDIDIDIDIDKDKDINNILDIDIDINKPVEISNIDINYQNIKETWNKLEKYGIKGIKVINPYAESIKNLKRCLALFTPDSFEMLIDQIKQSDYLLGNTTESKGVNFSWAVVPENYRNILKGVYKTTNRAKTKVKNFVDIQEHERPDGYFDELERKLLEN